MEISRYLSLVHLQRCLQDEIEAHQSTPYSEIPELCKALSCQLQPQIDVLYTDIHAEISRDFISHDVMSSEWHDDITDYSLPVVQRKH